MISMENKKDFTDFRNVIYLSFEKKNKMKSEAEAMNY